MARPSLVQDAGSSTPSPGPIGLNLSKSNAQSLLLGPHRKNQSFDVAEKHIDDENVVHKPAVVMKGKPRHRHQQDTTVIDVNQIPADSPQAVQPSISSESNANSQNGVPHLDNAVRTSHDLNGSNQAVKEDVHGGASRKRSESEVSQQDQPVFGITHKKGSDSIVSDNGTHYISYEQEQESAVTVNHGDARSSAVDHEDNGNILDVEQQRIDDIMLNMKDISAIKVLSSQK